MSSKRTKKRKNKRERKPVQSTRISQPPQPPQPVKPSYASMLSAKTNDDPKVSVNTSGTVDEYDKTHVSHLPRRRLVTNYTPPRGRDRPHDTWEWAYFRHLLELREIFVSGMCFVNPNIDVETLYTPEFFENFSQFVYEASSRHISPYLEPLSERLLEEYSKYLIKRNENM